VDRVAAEAVATLRIVLNGLSPMKQLKIKSELAIALGMCRSAFAGAAAFSVFINVLVLVPSIYMLQIYDRILSSRNETTLWVMTLVAVGLIAVYAALETVRSQILVKIGRRLDQLLGGRLFSAVFKSAVRRPDGGSSQALRDLDMVRDFLTGQGLFALFDAPWVPIYTALVFVIHPVLGVISMFGAIIIFGLALTNELATHNLLRDATTQNFGATRFVDSSLRNVEALEAMGMLEGIYARWQAKRWRSLQFQSQASDRAGAIMALLKFVRIVLQMSILGVGAYLVIQNEITAGLMIAASIVMGRALAPVEIAVATWKQFLAARSAYGRLNDLLQAVPALKETMPLPAPRGEVTVENVVVAAPGGRVPILRGVNFRVAAGDIIGIIGPSAAGKSTLARAIVGVWPVFSGTIRIDGADINSWDRNRLGPHIGYLPQDVELFEGTIAENIARFGDVDPDKVIAAAQHAGVHQLILDLPNGYDTEIGQGGMTLSGGQRQRVALARALYGAPQILVLDEPNSNLDTSGEAALAQAMTEVKAQRQTTFVITHRVHILAQVDYIIALSQGVIEKFGTRDQILSQFMKPVASPAPASRA
jgi:PrtD family type I secretion system ABC transporter